MSDHKIYYASRVSPAQNKSPISENITAYLQENPGTGYLTFEIYDNSPVKGRVPVPNAKITVSKPIGDDYYISKILTTDANGETDPLPLPTVSRDLSMTPGEGRVFSTYHVSVEAPGFQRKDIYNIQIFEGITSVQRVPMQHNAQSGRAGAGTAGNSVR